jgi:uncharacterized RDD family membrane protein YckC
MVESGMSARYAGFWIRLFAGIIDVILVYAVLLVVFKLIIMMAPGAEAILQPPHPALQQIGAEQYQFAASDPYFIKTIVFLMYYSLMESSSMQATIGMKICGLKISDANFQRISFLRALGRELAAYLSAIIIFIGYFMIGWTEKKQGLHDMIASTLVVRR